MKENREVTDTNVGDIEEAVKTMEHWVEYEKNNKYKINKADELIYIQETILSDYKRVLKEKEELKNQEATARKINELLVERYSNSIQVQKVKDKIEELKSNPLKIKQNDKYYFETHAYNKIIISVLQELIEESEK